MKFEDLFDLVDTHCHLTIMGEKLSDESAASCCGDSVCKSSDEQVKCIVEEAAAAGVKKIITISTKLDDSVASVELAERYQNVYATVGIHPCDCSDYWQDDFEKIRGLMKHKSVVGVGETGLDFYHKPFFKQRQIDAFKTHIECALENDLPLVVHIRESADEVLKVLEQFKGQARGVAHCFYEKKDIADILIEWGFYLGIGGTISYPKNDWLRELFSNIPLESILLETDAPFLPPQQYRGKRNHPKYLPLVAQVIADLHGVDLKIVAERTTENAHSLFGLVGPNF